MTAVSMLAPVTLFHRMGLVANLVLPDGHRFVSLSRTGGVAIIPIEEPGSYEVDIGWIAEDEDVLPVAIATVDLAHVPLWQKLSMVQVGLMLDRLERAFIDAQSAGPKWHS